MAVFRFKGRCPIDGMNNAVISDKPVNVGATNKVALKNITFTAPDNSSETHPVNNASSLYANDFSGSLIIDGCTFVDAPWDALQITPFEGAEIIITNNIFANDAITGYRYVHIQNVTGTEIRATIKMNGNDFKGVADMTDGGAICIEGIIYDESIVDYSGNTFDVDDLSPNGDNLAYLWLADGFAYSGNVVNYDNLLDPEVYCK